MKAISFPFTLDSFGRIVSTESPNKIYLDRVLTVLSTAPYGKPMKPHYGTNIARSLYETNGRLGRSIEEAIRRALSTYIPEVSIVSLTIIPAGSDGQATVDLTLELPDNTVESLSVKTSTFLPDGTTLGNII